MTKKLYGILPKPTICTFAIVRKFISLQQKHLACKLKWKTYILKDFRNKHAVLDYYKSNHRSPSKNLYRCFFRTGSFSSFARNSGSFEQYRMNIHLCTTGAECMFWSHKLARWWTILLWLFSTNKFDRFHLRRILRFGHENQLFPLRDFQKCFSENWNYGTKINILAIIKASFSQIAPDYPSTY